MANEDMTPTNTEEAPVEQPAEQPQEQQPEAAPEVVPAEQPVQEQPAPEQPVGPQQAARKGATVGYVLENGCHPGVVRPAVVLELLGDDQYRLDLLVFTNGTNDFDQNQPGSAGTMLKSAVAYDQTKQQPNTWHELKG